MSSDGTTAVQVSPIPTESEMTRIRQIFEYAANAIVRASELGKKVDDLQAQFDGINSDLGHAIAKNDELVQSLQEVRLQRDEAQSKLVEVRSSLSNMNAEFDKVVADAKAKSEQIEKLNAENTTVTRQYLDEIDVAEGHRKRAEAAEAALAKIKGALGIPEVAAKPEPIPQPDAPTPIPAPTTESVTNPEPYAPYDWSR